ncbi:MAG: sulfotransferase family 2 domain-containing protein [Hyphomicrobium sp.]
MSPLSKEQNRKPDARALLVYVHIPKAGGTSFTELLDRVYGQRFLHLQKQRLLHWPPEYYVSAVANRYDAIAGHLPYGMHKRFGRGFSFNPRNHPGAFDARDLKYISIMRDPVERVKSFYRYVTTTPSHRYHRHAKGLPPAAFFRHLEGLERNALEVRNQQSRMLGRGCHGDLDAIKKRIREDYFAVGVLENVDPFVAHLRQTLGWPATAALPHLNRTSTRRTEDEFDAATLDWISANNTTDLELYAFVRDEGQKYWKS